MSVWTFAKFCPIALRQLANLWYWGQINGDLSSGVMLTRSNSICCCRVSPTCINIMATRAVDREFVYIGDGRGEEGKKVAPKHVTSSKKSNIYLRDFVISFPSLITQA